MKFSQLVFIIQPGDRIQQRGETLITQQELKRLFIYDPDTGILRNRIARRGSPRGRASTLIDKDGYLLRRLCGRNYRVHRLIWLYVHGKWPAKYIHHKDCNPGNNRLANLCEATPRENNQRTTLHKTKLVGANFHSGKWQSAISKNGKLVYLGRFNSALEAHRAYMKEAAKCR